jgi:hypothetical protein
MATISIPAAKKASNRIEAFFLSSRLALLALRPDICAKTGMVAETEDHPSESVTAAVWTDFAMMCIGMFMAILDVQVVATSLATI